MYYISTWIIEKGHSAKGSYKMQVTNSDSYIYFKKPFKDKLFNYYIYVKNVWYLTLKPIW